MGAGHRPPRRSFGMSVSDINVSIPAYDKAKGIVLVYLCHPRGTGNVFAYQLKGGKLILLKRVLIWVG